MPLVHQGVEKLIFQRQLRFRLQYHQKLHQACAIQLLAGEAVFGGEFVTGALTTVGIVAFVAGGGAAAVGG